MQKDSSKRKTQIKEQNKVKYSTSFDVFDFLKVFIIETLLILINMIKNHGVH